MKEHVAHSLAVPVCNSEVCHFRSCTARLITQQHGDVGFELFVRHAYLPDTRSGDQSNVLATRPAANLFIRLIARCSVIPEQLMFNFRPKD